jgi:LPS export ABC transporter protein LptC
MASWRKHARAGVAIVGIVVAGLVYFAMRERETAPAPGPVNRLDPKAILEVTQGVIEGITGIEKNFEVKYKTLQTYDDGSTKFLGATIVVHKGEDRTFTVSANEARTGNDQQQFQLTGSVRLEDSDGFFLTTDQATYDRKDSIAVTPSAVAFGKGRMSGSGVGITYDQANNVLVVADQAQVTTRNEAGEPVMEFTSGTATLDRTQHRLTVGNAVHVVRGEQVIEADSGVASLSENDDVVRYMELRGNSRVEGGDGGIDAMSARDINLDYTDDGQRLEAVSLNGTGAVARKGQNGAAQQVVAELIDLLLAEDGSSRMVLKGNSAVTMVGEATERREDVPIDQRREGRHIAADSLELDLATDGSLTRAVGRDGVRLDLPAVADAPVRSIRANNMDGTGEAGKGLTSATFAGNVSFTEEARGGAAGTPAKEVTARTARADRLQASLADDAVTSATFTVNVTFEEAGLKGCANRADYDPDKGTLALSGATPEGNPIVVEEQVAIEARAIDVSLATRRMIAKEDVVTRTRTLGRCRPATARPASAQGPNRLPGLLKQDQAATVTAGSLDYEGQAGKAVYAGKALLSQGGDTSIRADSLALDQKNGDLTATGNAMSTMILDNEVSTGRAHEIRYTDAKRVIRYAAPPPGTGVPPAPAAPRAGTPAPAAPATRCAVIAREPQLSGPQGELSAAERIDIVLAEGGGKAERIEAYANVRLRQDERQATGGARLTYYAADQKYVMEAGPSAPVRLLTACRESRGKTLTFFRANDTIEIDGKSERRTQTTNPCTPPAPQTR